MEFSSTSLDFLILAILANIVLLFAVFIVKRTKRIVNYYKGIILVLLVIAEISLTIASFTYFDTEQISVNLTSADAKA